MFHEEVADELNKLTGMKKGEILRLLEKPKYSNLGDIAFPCFELAKIMKKSPIVLSQELAQKLSASAPPKGIVRIQALGPYINFFVDKSAQGKFTISNISKQKDKYGSSTEGRGKKIVIEFPSPNTNKPLHIGHARNMILGQSVSNILRFMGNKVIVTNLNNDRGVHICKSMIAYDLFGNGDTPEKSKIKSDHLIGDYYVRFGIEAEKNPSLEEQAQDCLRKWEKGDKKTIALWKKMNKWAFDGFNETYRKFDLKIDQNFFESRIYKKGKDIIQAQLKKGVVKKKEDGALYMDLNDLNLGEKILLRADGTSIYITQDLYLAVLKQKKFKFDKSIYVVAREQDRHFQALFEILRRFGYAWAENMHHLSYGMVNLESGRMKSREGKVVDADDLIEELKSLASEEIAKRWPELKGKELSQRSTAIAMAALRYYFLRSDMAKDMTFKPEESLAFEGDSGPYLLYTYARAKSIIAKSGAKKGKKFEFNPPSSAPLEQEEKEIITLLSEFEGVVKETADKFSPHLIANYLTKLSDHFNAFYEQCPVLKECVDERTKESRLAITAAVSQVLNNGMLLLGMTPLEKM